MRKKLLTLFLLSAILATFTACSTHENTETNIDEEFYDVEEQQSNGTNIEEEQNSDIFEETQDIIILDVNKFANITSKKLISIMGEPDEITETNERGFTEFPCTLYDYTNSGFDFLRFDLINDKVTRITIINDELPYN